MNKILIIIFAWLAFGFYGHSQNNEYIVFTAYQNFNSRLYVLEMDGTVVNYHEYLNYRLQDMTVINNEVFVSDAFIPCVYKVDIYTGELELIVHDTWLFYFYGLAWDGNYFYVNEWDLNRYDITGQKDGTADFDEDVMGATFANGWYWMLNNENEIKCWDFDAWPDLLEIPAQHFLPPTPDCRGLWYDGEYFWTAESVENNIGKIYRFDFDGQVLEQWNAPAFRGWGACKVDVPPLAVAGNNNTSFEMTVSPNPAKDFLNISFTIDHPGMVTLLIHDLEGTVVQQKSIATFPIGKHTCKWAIEPNIKIGTYIIAMRLNNCELRQKIIVSH